MNRSTRRDMLISFVLLITAMGVWAETHEVQLLSGPFRFEPNDLVIQAGDTVRWINNSGFHSVDADDDSFARAAGSSPWTFERNFDESGEILYHCNVHSSAGRDINQFMNGRLTVEPASASFAPGENVKGSWFEVGGISSGQGLLVDYFPDIDALFVAWFTFEAPTTAKVGAPDQRWLTTLMGIDGDTASGTLLSTSGGFFDTPRPDTQIDGAEVGTITIEFVDCANAQLHYELPAEGLSGDIAIERLDQFLFPNTFSCP